MSNHDVEGIEKDVEGILPVLSEAECVETLMRVLSAPMDKQGLIDLSGIVACNLVRLWNIGHHVEPECHVLGEHERLVVNRSFLENTMEGQQSPEIMKMLLGPKFVDTLGQVTRAIVGQADIKFVSQTSESFTMNKDRFTDEDERKYLPDLMSGDIRVSDLPGHLRSDALTIMAETKEFALLAIVTLGDGPVDITNIEYSIMPASDSRYRGRCCNWFKPELHPTPSVVAITPAGQDMWDPDAV